MTLRPYQEALLEAIATSAGRVLVTIPIGGGKTESITEFVARSEPASTVVLTDRRVLVEQWRSRFLARGFNCVTIDSSADLLESVDHESTRVPEPNVLIITVQRLRGSLGRYFSERYRPDLVVVDLPASSLLDQGSANVSAVIELSRNADRTLWLSNSSLDWMPLIRIDATPVRFDSVISVPLREVFESRGAALVVTTVSYEGEAADSLLRDGRLLLRRVGVQEQSAGIQGLHNDLVMLASGYRSSSGDDTVDVEQQPLAGREGLEVEAWQLIDALENLDGDSRLEAYIRFVKRTLEEGRSCVTLTPKIGEMEYLAAELSSAGVQANVVGTHVSQSARNQALTDFATDGTVLLGGYGAITQLPVVERPLVIVLWSLTHQVEQLEQIVIWATLRSAELVILASSSSGEEGTGAPKIIEEVVARLQVELAL